MMIIGCRLRIVVESNWNRHYVSLYYIAIQIVLIVDLTVILIFEKIR